LRVEVSKFSESSLVGHEGLSSYYFSKFQILNIELTELVKVLSNQITEEDFF
jgi:hypothetical protein